jgi:hypothetical protein
MSPFVGQSHAFDRIFETEHDFVLPHPQQMTGILLTRWTVRLALACYVLYLAGWLLPTGPGWPRMARWVWTLGCVLFLAHVAAAFHFYHHWSHAAAYETTARETAELLGVRFGEGIYFSYLFAVAWVADVAGMWLAARGDGRQQGPWIAAWPRLAVHAYLLFIALNGAIVFEAGPTRWAGLLACLGLSVLAGRAAYNRLNHRSVPSPPAATLSANLAGENQTT